MDSRHFGLDSWQPLRRRSVVPLSEECGLSAKVSVKKLVLEEFFFDSKSKGWTYFGDIETCALGASWVFGGWDASASASTPLSGRAAIKIRGMTGM